MSDLTCPYCEATIDHDRADLWEYENEDEIECPECEKSFILLVEVTYEYTGRRHECQNGEHELVWVGEEGDGSPVCRHCWGFVPYAFEAVDQPEPSLGYCDGCDELEAELHLMDGDWLCDKCKATVIAVQEDKAKAKEDLKTAGDDHWEMIKARVFIAIFVVWVCFAIWGKYVS